MPDSDHLNDETLVEHLVDDAIVADPHAIGVGFTAERSAAWWSRLVGQEIDGRSDPMLLLPG